MKDFGKCDLCGSEGNLTFVGEEGSVCESCLDEYILCPECGEYYQVNSIQFYELKDGSTLCQWCGEEVDEDEIAEIHDWT